MMLSSLEQKILDCLIAEHPHGIGANAIARKIGEKPAYVMNALGHMRDKAIEVGGKWTARGIVSNKPKVNEPKPISPIAQNPKPQIPFPPTLREAAPYKPLRSMGEPLFEFCVKKILEKHLWQEKNLHNVWANKLFKYESNSNMRNNLMTNVKQEFDIYFTRGKEYAFDLQKIVQDYPQWFKGSEVTEYDDPILQLHYEIQHAIQKEKREATTDANKQIYTITNLEEIPRKSKSSYIYLAELDVPDGEEPHLREGIAVGLIVGRYAYTCEVVDYDIETAELILTSSGKIPTTYNYIRLEIDTTFILDALRKRWNNLAGSGIDENLPIYKFVLGQTEDLTDIDYIEDPDINRYQLDTAQLQAYNAALSKDITFIWGPPGTGKSYTLAAIIRSLYKQPNERTIVCCVSNVAVDQLVNKVVDILEQEGEQVPPGNYYRAGHTIDERILATDFLFPEDDLTKEIRLSIKKIQQRIKGYEHWTERKEDIIQLKADLKDLRENLNKHTDELVKKSKVVFSTNANFVVSDKINQTQFDNLIVDEASMLSMPSLVALAGKITKRIILVGDFQQLSPISLVPDKWLKQNVFELCGIDIRNTEHPALYQLLNQRRSRSAIVSLINETFYKNKLVPSMKAAHPIVECEPFAGKVVVTKVVDDGAVRFTKGGTRQNVKSAEEVIKLIDEYAKHPIAETSIGIITPYKGQVGLIRALIYERQYPESIMKSIKVGTVHTFQGSECDVIICDFVDSRNFEKRGGGLGKIYAGNEGEKLLNVAVSRARHKLIAVGDIDYLANPLSNMISGKTINVFERLRNQKEASI